MLEVTAVSRRVCMATDEQQRRGTYALAGVSAFPRDLDGKVDHFAGVGLCKLPSVCVRPGYASQLFPVLCVLRDRRLDVFLNHDVRATPMHWLITTERRV
jgi:hypothetical protein